MHRVRQSGAWDGWLSLLLQIAILRSILPPRCTAGRRMLFDGLAALLGARVQKRPRCLGDLFSPRNNAENVPVIGLEGGGIEGILAKQSRRELPDAAVMLPTQVCSASGSRRGVARASWLRIVQGDMRCWIAVPLCGTAVMPPVPVAFTTDVADLHQSAVQRVNGG
jgi:hypothetical protein